MASHTISVTVGKDSIQVVPNTLMMTSVDDVRWADTNSKVFSIVFDDATAFGSELAHSAATTPKRPRAKGRFKYTVVSGDDPSVRLDPEVVVGDPPTDPNP
jgi:hypothetical protein